MEPYRIDFAAQPWEEPLAGVRCKTKRLDGRQLRLVEYTQEMSPHWCERGHTGLVLEGRLEIRFARATEEYGPGDGVHIPAGHTHRHMARVLTEKVKVVFVEDV
jgi:quercetin dioxygenase-like cupin family protein